MEYREPVEEQPLTEREREIVRRGRKLFRIFWNEGMERRAEYRKFRDIRRLKDDELQNQTAPRINVLNSTIDTIIADQMDNPLEAVMIPEREETVRDAEIMTDVVRYCLDRCAWDAEYEKIMEDVAVLGTAYAEVSWDEEAEGGSGLAVARHVRTETVYTDPAYADIQDGRAAFKCVWTTREWVEEHFPECAKYDLHDEYTAEGDGQKFRIDAQDDEPVMVMDYWYRRYNRELKRYETHLAKMCGRTLLYLSEREDDKKDGVYGHGMYPFAVFTYRKDPEKPGGRGLMDDYADQWRAICRYSKYIDDNARLTSRPRYMYREGDNVEDLADVTRDLIPVQNLNEEHLRRIETPSLNGSTFTYMQFLIETMKQDSGQNQFTRGEGGMGITAASAIQALQEAGGKTARMHTAGYKETFRKMIEQMIWVLSDYLDERRVLLVTGGEEQQELRQVELRPVGGEARQNGRIPKPPYVARVQVQKKNPLQIQADNQFVLQMAEISGQAGRPMAPTAVLRLLRGVNGKGEIMRALEEADAVMQQMQQLQAQVEQMTEQLKQETERAALQKRVIAEQNAKLTEQRTPSQTNAPGYSMLETTVGVNRAEL